ncbi:tetratricopeptide repeat-containing protein [Metabacillus bambusae]|uniref:Guanylate cyclase domain-containing protein n=1 Tax=Metabacillus bambusae TaxID=2795218 RepID=A0ABS3N7W3_9BACI|nr:tetratricopeptide repeat-containing protein [Metabacillus bambusae]MBO1514347.1 hypothetical protein [Metabacillus bambusae]
MRDFNGFIIFADLKGFSSMGIEGFESFEYTLRPLSHELSEYKTKARVWNTWGDALVAVFKDGIDAVNLMITYRDFFRKNRSLQLEPRIAGHHGNMLIFNDPMLNNTENVIGKSVNTAARIEPITFPGEIYVSEDFKRMFIEEKDGAKLKDPYYEFGFHDLLEWDLPKNHGIIHLYRLFHIKEEAWNINELFIKKQNKTLDDLFSQLDVNAEIKAANKAPIISQLKQMNSKEEVLNHLNGHLEINKIDQQSGPQLIAFARVYIDIGEYEQAIKLIEEAQKWRKVIKDQIEIFPLKENPDILKLKAHCLSKNKKYVDAKKILYGLLQSNPEDNDTICSLAAQLKREAFTNKDDEFHLDTEMLTESLHLYLEAFRKQGDYYPAINAAYIQKILGHSDGWHLSSYIFNTWSEDTGKDWWIDSTLAETQLLLGEFKFAYNRMTRAIAQHKPKFFEKHATKDQIESYIEIMNKREKIKKPTDKEQEYIKNLLDRLS